MAWRGHYHGRSRDCASLEFSTVRLTAKRELTGVVACSVLGPKSTRSLLQGVPFAEWTRCVEVLCGPADSELSLLHALGSC
jgi:hypothetical protein